MNILLKSVLIFFLVLTQVTFLPINLAFTFVVGLGLFGQRMSYSGWLVLVAFLLFLFSAGNWGLILLSLTLSFIFIQFFREVLPVNTLSKAFLLVLSLPLSEVVIKLIGGYFK